MHFLQPVVAASALASIVTAAPCPAPHTKRSSNLTVAARFTVPQGLPRLPGRKIAGPVALERAYGKYAHIGATLPRRVRAAASTAKASDDGTVEASPLRYDHAYLSPVTVGGQTLNLGFDTGSSDLWVFSSELPAKEQANHNIYNPAASSTSQISTGQTWSISYGDGSSASGNVYTDVVDVGGISVTGQAVELANTVSANFVQNEFDGLLGLAFSNINSVKPDQVQTFFANAECSLDKPLFTANLKRGAPGSYNFGYVDDSEYTGDITYTAVDNSQGFWAFNSSGFTIGTAGAVTHDIIAIADTGSSLLLLEDSIVDAYYARVDGASNNQTEGGYVFDCSTTLPDLTLTIEGYDAVVPGNYFNYAPASESGNCFGGLQSSAGIGLSIFGDVFLKSQFVVFEDARWGPRLGFAAKDL